MGGRTHAGPAVGAVAGAPYGATILVRDVPKWAGGRMRTLPRWPSVEPLWGHDPREGRARMGWARGEQRQGTGRGSGR
eukprot:9502227-Pyramimonas_sp.AAC.2